MNKYSTLLILTWLGLATAGSKPERIVSLVPSHTEIIFALGAGRHLVGVCKWCNYPPEAQSIAKVAELSPDVEQISQLKPDIILADISHKASSRDLNKIQTYTIFYPATTARNLNEVYNIIDNVGHKIGYKREAHELIHRLKAKVRNISELTRRKPRPKVYLEVWSKPIMSAGGNTLLNNLIEAAGGENITVNNIEMTPRLSAEYIMTRDPEIIIVLDKTMVEAVSKRPGWSQISAVRKGRVTWIDPDIITRAGPRIADGLEELAKILHPEVFTK